MNWSEIFYYDESSPTCLRWAIDIPYKGLFGGEAYKCRVGDVVGTINKDGRTRLKYQQRVYLLHRVVWEILNGKPHDDLVVDHKDGDPSNNRVGNLRLVSREVNCRNSRQPVTNKTGVTGVNLTEFTMSGKLYRYYVATWSVSGKSHHRNFSIKKLGEDEAFRRACEFRDTMIASLNATGAGYTERHGT